MIKKAKLVAVHLMTRVIVDADASEEVICRAAEEKMIEKIRNHELYENLEFTEDDLECPYGCEEAFNNKDYVIVQKDGSLLVFTDGTTVFYGEKEEAVKDAKPGEKVMLYAEYFIRKKYDAFIQKHEREMPLYAKCLVKYKDDNSTLEASIKLSLDVCEEDDTLIFFNCSDLSDLIRLVGTSNGEDFIISDFYGFSLKPQ